MNTNDFIYTLSLHDALPIYGYNFNPNGFNPSSYASFNNPSNPNALPQQQIIQVNGKASVDTIQLAPNSSVLVMDTSQPIVWMCVSDGVGRVTATPYDISVHKDAPSVDMTSVEKRLANVEAIIANLIGGTKNESDGAKPNSKQNSTD